MIEKVTVNNIRCDVCLKVLPNNNQYKHVFQNDVCDDCLGKILQKVESEKILTMDQFKDIIDTIRYKF